MSEYDAHTAVSQVSEGEFTAELTDGWRVGGGLNGGYLLAMLGRALSASFPEKPDPLSVSAYYASTSVAGPAQVRVRPVRVGGSMATAAAELWQGDDLRITALATYGRLADLPDEVMTTAEEPVLPPVEECVSNEHAPAEVRAVAPAVDRFDMFFDPATVGWAIGQPSGNGMLQAWFRLPDHEPDPVSLLTVVDALPPVTFDLGRPGWAPTIELTAHVRAVPEKGWLKVRHETRNVAGGMFEEDCVVWDSAGRLVAQSRQLARLPRERG